jgi:CRP/FNR family cyclic AMP-dependent transcriptional regulator
VPLSFKSAGHTHTMEDIPTALASMRLFQGLTARGLAHIATVAIQETHERNTLVFHEGDAGGKLYIILEGRIRISRSLGGVGEEALAVLGPGEAFGEMSLIEDTSRSADAHVHERCRLLVITREAFENLLFVHKDIACDVLWNFVKVLTQRLREANDKLAFLSVTGRF